MKDRSLRALGLDGVPAVQPLTYPGRPATEPSLLNGDVLLQLGVRPMRLGDWYVEEAQERERRRLDETLSRLGQAPTGRRHPVIAVGSNASPGQVSHKLSRMNLPTTVPMVPVRVRGIGVGCSGHISPAGYVAGTPYIDPQAESTLVVAWLDAQQLKAVDDTEFPDYQRAILPGDAFDMTMPSGERLGGAYIYFSAHGVLARPDGRPHPGGGDQSELLAELLAGSARLRELLGPDPVSWVARAGADREVREQGTRIFGKEGWVLPQTDFLPYVDGSPTVRLYDDLPPLSGSLPVRASAEP
ncbi:hypothetical protein [Streptomyces solicathayae]|uniref:Uncharacterized protein n=1 Tax=Streptomyces solicathayae TaxID=3081768 RepID=A0ABZ0LRC0_9ACTN|nr:hypothetical protein [Streptomyces sp. HUAS YS2]WOX22024.1 hypothetical protein R2D22_11720 [Streptomyces sp. HUAS YS2]